MGCLPVDELIIGHGAGQGSGAVPLPQLSPDLSPTLMLHLADTSVSEHIVTHSAEHFKLLKPSEIGALSSLTDGFKQVAFKHYSPLITL
jgi:hypothetical protein